MEASMINGLYPIVQDLTEIEYGITGGEDDPCSSCCCDSQQIFGSFSLEELAVPVVTPRPANELTASPLLVYYDSPSTTPGATLLPNLRLRASPPSKSSSFSSTSSSKSTTKRRSKRNTQHHRRGNSMGILASLSGGTVGFHKRSNSSPGCTNRLDTEDATTICTESEERVIVSDMSKLNEDIIKFNDVYVLTRQILRCNLSTVWECVHRDSGVRYCVKVIDRRRFSTSADEDTALREIAMLTSIADYKSPRIVHLVQVMEDTQNFYIITQLTKYGNLLTKLTQHQQEQSKQQQVLSSQQQHLPPAQPSTSSRTGPSPLLSSPSILYHHQPSLDSQSSQHNRHRNRPSKANRSLSMEWSLTEGDVRELARSLLQGVNLLHSLGICHHDLQPENILLQEDNQVEICDFGCAVYLHGDYCCRGRYGSLSYAAPEVIVGENHGTVSDLWSVGVILYYCLCGWLPFEDTSRYQLKEKIIKGDYSFAPPRNNVNNNSPHCPNVWDSISRPAKQFLSNLLQVNPQVRLTAAEALNHPWLEVEVPPPPPPPSSASPVTTPSKSSKRRRLGSLAQRFWARMGATTPSTTPNTTPTSTSPSPFSDMEGGLQTSSTISSSY